MYNNLNNNVKSAMNEIFNSLEGFSLDASRSWKKLACFVSSYCLCAKDNENNRHLFVSSVVVVSSISHTVGARTRADYPFIVYIRMLIHKLKYYRSILYA